MLSIIALKLSSCALKLKLGDRLTVADIDTGENVTINTPSDIQSKCGKKCHKETTTVNVTNGLVLTKENMLDSELIELKDIDKARDICKECPYSKL